MNFKKYEAQFRSYFNNLQKTVHQHQKMVGSIIGVVALSMSGTYAYHYFDKKNEQAASVILEDCLHEYQEAQQAKKSLDDVALMCQAGYDKFSKTKVAPYILAVLVDVLLEQKKLPEAHEKLALMMSHLPGHSPLYNLYELKSALLKLDLDDPALQTSGLQELERLAANTSNIYNDEAQFYLGLYYRQQGNSGRAKEVWSQLIAVNEHADEQGRSPWASLAQEKMNGLS